VITYALDELRDLVNGLPTPVEDRSPIVRYLCSLIAELAYYHVPQWEIDGRKRAKLIPCEAYQAIVARGVATTPGEVLRKLDLGATFVVEDRGVIAVGLATRRLLFIGFRGTQFLFDWKINLRCRLAPVSTRVVARAPFLIGTASGRFHQAFAEESMRISSRILDAIRDSNLGPIDHVFMTGHSLGGAVAAISEAFIRIAPTSTCLLAAPRYADLSAYATNPDGPATQVRRPGDIVPRVPPKSFGYVDHPYEFATTGRPYFDPKEYSSLPGEVLRWSRFLAGRFEAHSVEAYRRELGATAHAQGAQLALAPIEPLTLRGTVEA